MEQTTNWDHNDTRESNWNNCPEKDILKEYGNICMDTLTAYVSTYLSTEIFLFQYVLIIYQILMNRTSRDENNKIQVCSSWYLVNDLLFIILWLPKIVLR